MFIGAVNADIRKYIHSISREFEGRRLFIACSGNFTIEQLLSRNRRPAKIYSNDISTYSTILAHAVKGEVMDLKVVDKKYKFISKDLKSDRQLANVIWLLETLKYEKQKSDHAKRMFVWYMDHRPELVDKYHEKITPTVESIDIDQFYCEDVTQFISRADRPDDVVMSYLPTYTGGYEKLYQRLDEIVDWDRPEYGMIDEEVYEQLFARIRGKDHVFYADRDLGVGGMKYHLRQKSNKDIYLYTNLGQSSILVDHTGLNETVKKYPTIQSGDEITVESLVELVLVPCNVVNHYRFLYLKKGIQMADGDLAYLVLVGGKVIGAYIFSLSKFGSLKDLFMLSDFSLPTSRYKRLSKLLLLLSTSVEVQENANKKFLLNFSRVVTAVFSKRAMSMKYRGVFDLLKRNEETGVLNYGAEMGTRTIKGALEEWVTKHSEHQK